VNIPTCTIRQAARLITESDEQYPRIIRLNDRWRVIECRDRQQWILQARNRAETVATDVWRGRSYCRTREALIRCCDRYAGALDPAALAALGALPERYYVRAAAAIATGASMEARHAG
jgi:hypothetical protein